MSQCEDVVGLVDHAEPLGRDSLRRKHAQETVLDVNHVQVTKVVADSPPQVVYIYFHCSKTSSEAAFSIIISLLWAN